MSSDLHRETGCARGGVCMCAQLVRTLRHVLSARDWWHLPRFAFGSSRGGAMTLILALRFPFQVEHALSLQVSAIALQRGS